MDFLASRIDAHQKHGWMLRSYLKDQRAWVHQTLDLS
jgi:hypothetical protein